MKFKITKEELRNLRLKGPREGQTEKKKKMERLKSIQEQQV